MKRVTSIAQIPSKDQSYPWVLHWMSVVRWKSKTSAHQLSVETVLSGRGKWKFPPRPFPLFLVRPFLYIPHLMHYKGPEFLEIQSVVFVSRRRESRIDELKMGLPEPSLFTALSAYSLFHNMLHDAKSCACRDGRL
jgi:hypothetical protein